MLEGGCLGPEKGSLRKGSFHWGLFTGGISRISKISGLENGRILFCFPESGGFL